MYLLGTVRYTRVQRAQKRKRAPYFIVKKGVSMYRGERLVVRLNVKERAAVERLAQQERLPASTLARRLLLQEADRRGVWPGVEGQPLPREVRA